VIGFGTFVPRKNANVHLYGPQDNQLVNFTVLTPLCRGPQWSNIVRNDWAHLYHDHATPQEAAQARTVTCPKCLEYV